MASLADALALAARGFRVFPITEGRKSPPLVNFSTEATTDPALLAAYFPAGTNRNIGILTGDGFFVADIDTKNGKQGPSEFAAMGGSFKGLVFRTATGAYHALYLSIEPLGQAKLSDGIDVRAVNGYIVAPGSHLDGSAGDGIVGDYTILNDGPMDFPPPGLAAKLTPYAERKARPVADAPDMDDPRSIADAIHYLTHRAPVAIEGQNGDDVTYRVACAVRRDYGLSNESAYLLMSEHWNARCSPPWDDESLWAKVQHAEAYGTGAEGAATSARALDKISVPEISAARTPGTWEFGNAISEDDIRARDWIMHRFLLRGAVTALVATGAAGKTTLLLTIAALGAVGRPLHETMLCPAPFKSVVYDAEEPREELSRRLAAICAVLGLSWREVIPKIMLLGMDDLDFSLASGSPGQWTQNVALVDQLVAVASDPEVALVALGPLNKLSPLDVLDNTAMSWFMKLIGQIAVRADVSLLFSHHTSKDADRHGSAGSAGSALGAASIINSVRIAYTMSPLSPDDLIEQRIPESEANRYVKLNDAKMNLTLKSSSPIVLHRAEYRLKSGDLIGALKLHQAGRADLSDIDILARAVHDLMGERETGKVPSGDVIARWQQLDPSRASVSASALLKRLAKLMQERSNRILFTDAHGTAHVFTTIKPTANRLDFVYADAVSTGV